MLISLLIPKNMQNFSQFYRLISKILFFSTQKLQVRFPTGGAATGSLPGRPERLKNVPDHPAEARVPITRGGSSVGTLFPGYSLFKVKKFCSICNVYIFAIGSSTVLCSPQQRRLHDSKFFLLWSELVVHPISYSLISGTTGIINV